MVVHVDFGDCFETAMMRDKYPEKARSLAILARLTSRRSRSGSRACSCVRWR